MKLRLILFALSLLTFLSTWIGGYLYYTSLTSSAVIEAERQAVTRVEIIQKNLSAFLSENIRPVRTLAGMDKLRAALTRPTDETLAGANAILDHFNASLDVDVCYLIDRSGNTIASSNREAPDSFVGKNFGFRPYFKASIQNQPYNYLALGTASGVRGAYYSHPIYGEAPDNPVGIVVIKAAIDQIEKQLDLTDDEIVLVTDPQGVIFISNRRDWLYHLLWELPPAQIADIRTSQQFGDGPWLWTGLTVKGSRYMKNRQGEEYLVHQRDIRNFPGWSVLHLRSAKAISAKVFAPLIRITGPIVLTLCILIGLTVFFLYRKASQEISQRRVAEEALRTSEERYRSLYHNTPAMLHSIDTEGRILSVSDYWVEALGYDRAEVIGRKLTDFYTAESRRHAETVVFPDFFKAGFCKDIPYQFVKKNGEIIDVLLSAISDRDEQGRTIRSLAVSVDVTDRKRAEKALKHAQKKLQQHSRNLERLVKKRTGEITSILKYTPDVVYIKDKNGRYRLINARYEELLGKTDSEVVGRTDYDILPRGVADEFRKSDRRVLETGSPCQVAEQIPHQDGMHTYLSVKFPIFDERGTISGICGISTDITELKKAQDQLRRLSAGIMASQEKERSAIARELHDELGQVLTALRMEAVWMLDRLKNKDPKAALRALTMCELIDKNIEDIRGMAIRLRPGVLDDLGLVDALEWFTGDFEKRTGITCVFEHGPVPEISNTVATAAYRITQEALTNVTRHADATRVTVNLELTDGELELTAEDNGRGFAPETLDDAEGLGLAGMRERASLVGGRLTVTSRPSGGTRVHFTVPIRNTVNGGA